MINYDHLLAQHLDMTLREWIERYQREIVFDQVHYRGVPTWKNALDLWVYQEILWETQVDCVVEIGTRHGGTMLWLADVLRNFRGGKSLVISVDIAPPPPVALPENVRFVQGDSISAETFATVRELAAAHKVLVLADGNHAADHVLAELRLYAPLVPVGSYFIAEDGIVDVMDWKEFTPGPAVAARQFVTENDDFVIDRSREKFLLTYSPGGFVKRVKQVTPPEA